MAEDTSVKPAAPVAEQPILTNGPIGYDIVGMMRSTVNDVEKRKYENGVPTQTIAQETRAFAELVRDENMQIPLARELMVGHTRARFAAPVDDATAFEQRVELNRRVLRQEADRYGRGEKEAEQLIARTRAWVQRTPRLAEMLAVGNLGSDPEVVGLLVEHVRVNNIR